MGFKLVLNVLYTIGIALCFVVAYKELAAGKYLIAGGAIIVGVVVVLLKLSLLNAVKNTVKNPEKKQ